jgi:hypothetical protein
VCRTQFEDKEFEPTQFQSSLLAKYKAESLHRPLNFSKFIFHTDLRNFVALKTSLYDIPLPPPPTPESYRHKIMRVGLILSSWYVLGATKS